MIGVEAKEFLDSLIGKIYEKTRNDTLVAYDEIISYYVVSFLDRFHEVPYWVEITFRYGDDACFLYKNLKAMVTEEGYRNTEASYFGSRGEELIRKIY